VWISKNCIGRIAFYVEVADGNHVVIIADLVEDAAIVKERVFARNRSNKGEDSIGHGSAQDLDILDRHFGTIYPSENNEIISGDGLNEIWRKWSSTNLGDF
jgi:hypothetical protein